MKMMSTVLEWLKDRIRIREHHEEECFFLHSEFRYNIEQEGMLYENEK